MSSDKVYPSAKKLTQLGNSARRVANVFRQYWGIDGATPSENPAQLTRPRGDLGNLDVRKRLMRNLANVGGANRELRDLLGEVDHADPLDGMPNTEKLPKAYQPKAPTEKTVVGWPYEVNLAITELHELSAFIYNKVLQFGPADPKVFPSLQDVQRLEYAAQVLGDAAAGTAEPTDANGQPQDEDTPRARKQWTQDLVDREISLYKSQRALGYDDLVRQVQAGKQGAQKTAKERFGRNAIGNALGIPIGSRRLVSDSLTWQQIADDLQLLRKTKQKHSPVVPRKVGLDIAIEDQAASDGDTTEREVIHRETVSLLDNAMRDAKSEAEKESIKAIQDSFNLGKITDDQARESLELVIEQQKEARTQKMRSEM